REHAMAREVFGQWAARRSGDRVFTDAHRRYEVPAVRDASRLEDVAREHVVAADAEPLALGPESIPAGREGPEIRALRDRDVEMRAGPLDRQGLVAHRLASAEKPEERRARDGAWLPRIPGRCHPDARDSAIRELEIDLDPTRRAVEDVAGGRGE